MTRSFLAILLLLAAMFAPLSGTSQIKWLESNHELSSSSIATEKISAEGIEILAQSGTIYIKTPAKIEVRVFTILGQLVSQSTLSPGVSELRLNARGVYIIKIGNHTKKVAL